MLALKLGDVDQFPFLEAPDPRVVADGYRRLAEISAIDERRELTAIGRQLARLPIDVQLARMLVEAEKLGCLRELLDRGVASSASRTRASGRPMRGSRPMRRMRVFADPKSDFVGVLNLWRDYHAASEELTQSKLRDWCSRHFLSFLRMREWRELHRQLLLVVGELGWALDGASTPQRYFSLSPGGEGRGEGAARGEGGQGASRISRKSTGYRHRASTRPSPQPSPRRGEGAKRSPRARRRPNGRGTR